MTAPCPSRLYFPAAAPTLVLVDVGLLLGPLSPTPNSTLADAVRRIAFSTTGKPVAVADAAGGTVPPSAADSQEVAA